MGEGGGGVYIHIYTYTHMYIHIRAVPNTKRNDRKRKPRNETKRYISQYDTMRNETKRYPADPSQCETKRSDIFPKRNTCNTKRNGSKWKPLWRMRASLAANSNQLNSAWLGGLSLAWLWSRLGSVEGGRAAGWSGGRAMPDPSGLEERP